MAAVVLRANDRHAASNSAPPGSRLQVELLALQSAILDGRLPQFQLPAAARAQLLAGIARVDSVDQRNRDAYHSNARIASQPSPIPSNPSGAVGANEHKRRRIEIDLQAQTRSHRWTLNQERDAYAGDIDVDKVLALAQSVVSHTSGLKPIARGGGDVDVNGVVAPSSPQSSFDENDYYSSQAESIWSPTLAQEPAQPQLSVDTAAHTAEAPRKRQKLSRPGRRASDESNDLGTYRSDTTPPPARIERHDEADDVYVPADPGLMADYLGSDEDTDQTTSARDDSEYEPAAVSQENLYAPARPPPTPIVRNHLTHLAAPQASRVSALTVANQRAPGYELQLIDGRPEVVKVPRSRRTTAASRLSSASPPVNRIKTGRKARRANREAERSLKVKKKRERKIGLDMSNQILPRPHFSKPHSPLPEFQIRPQTGHASMPSYHEVPTEEPFPSIRFPAGPPVAAGNFSMQQLHDARVQPLRSTSTVLQVPVHPSSLEEQQQQQQQQYANQQHSQLHALQPQFGQQPAAFAQRNIYGQINAAPQPMQVTQQLETRLSMAPPPVPVRAAKRVVVDQFGNRYVEAERTGDQPMPPPLEGATYHPAVTRAPSRLSSAQVPGLSEPYDPANAHFDMPRNTRTLESPSTIEYIDGRRYRVREVFDGIAHTSTSPATSDFNAVQPMLASRPAAYQQHDSHDPMRYEMSNQYANTVAQPQQQLQLPRAYSVQPDHVQSLPLTYAPRQGSVAPVQYVRHEPLVPARTMSAVQPQPPMYGPNSQGIGAFAGNNFDYVETRTYDGQQLHIHPAEDFRQY